MRIRSIMQKQPQSKKLKERREIEETVKTGIISLLLYKLLDEGVVFVSDKIDTVTEG